MKKFNCLQVFFFTTLINTLYSQNWTEVTASKGLVPARFCVHEIAALTDSVVWVLTADCRFNNANLLDTFNIKILRTLNGGRTWETFEVPPAKGRISFSLYAFDSLNVWITSQDYNTGRGRVLFQTKDGGRTWADKYREYSAGMIVRFFDKNNGISFGFLQPSMSRTTDGGNTWTLDTVSVKPLSGESLQAVSAFGSIIDIKGDTIWLATTAGDYSRNSKLFRSIDKGKTWLSLNLNFTAEIPATIITSIAFKDSKNGMIATSDNSNSNLNVFKLIKIYTTSDGGNTWVSLSTLPSVTPFFYQPYIGVVPQTRNTYMMTGYDLSTTQIATLYTTNGGASWSNPIYINAGFNIYGITPKFSSAKVGWIGLRVINTDNKIFLYKWDGSNIVSSSNDIIENIALTVSPNPSTGIVHISWQDAQNTPPQYLKVSDALGQIVFEKKGFDVGTTSQSINLQGVANGLYFIELQNQNNRGVKKVMIQH